MRHPDHDELLPLQDDPLVGRGFNAGLQRKILERIDQAEQPRKFPTALVWSGSALAVCLLFVFLAMSNLNLSLLHKNTAQLADAPTGTAPNSGQNTAAGMNTEPRDFRSAVLIGLRTDTPIDELSSQSDSAASYRTILVAPSGNELAQAAEGNGILMPYRMNFWHIEPVVSEKRGQEVQILSASPAGTGNKLSSSVEEPINPLFRLEQSDELVISRERLLFVGNQYVAVEQLVALSDTDDIKPLYIKQIEQLGGERSVLFNRGEEPHIPFEQLFPNYSIHAEDHPLTSSTVHWTVVRKPGRWVAQLYIQDLLSSRYFAFKSQDVLAPMPQELVNHDVLSVAWDELWERKPNARDAFSSPDGETVAIVDGQQVHFYWNGTQLAALPSLTLDLQPGETIIMMQWATGSYVEQWQEKVSQILQ